MKDFRKLLKPSEFRTDDDFGGIVADMEYCKSTNQPFYLCKESKLKNLLTNVENKGYWKGFFVATGCLIGGFIVGIIEETLEDKSKKKKENRK